jgi:hypothetical protein
LVAEALLRGFQIVYAWKFTLIIGLMEQGDRLCHGHIACGHSLLCTQYGAISNVGMLRLSLGFGALPRFCGSTANWVRLCRFQLIHFLMNKRTLHEQYKHARGYDKKFLMLGFITLIRVLNSLIW